MEKYPRIKRVYYEAESLSEHEITGRSANAQT
jgi:hypothetical protein